MNMYTYVAVCTGEHSFSSYSMCHVHIQENPAIKHYSFSILTMLAF